MAERSHLLIFLLSFCTFAASIVPQEYPSSFSTCENSCLKTFPFERLSSVDKLSDACQRGCRFFLLINVVTKPKPKTPKPTIKVPSANDIPVVTLATNENEVNDKVETNDVASSPQLVVAPTSAPTRSSKNNSSKEECQASCMEAYRHTRQRYACHEGCAHMARETAFQEERSRQAELEEGARELASLAAVGPLLSSMFSQLYSGQPRFAILLSTSEDSDGPQTEDVFLLQQPQDQTIFLHASDSEPDDVLTDPALIRQLEASSSLDISLRLPEQRVRTFPASDHAPRFQSIRQSNQGHAAPADLLACLSTRYGVPKWLLGFLALITGILTAWLCLEPWDRAAILEENSEKQLLVETEDDEDEKIPLPIDANDMVKIPLESPKV